MSEDQTKITPSKLETIIDGVPVLCAPQGEFTNDKNQIIKYPNRVKIGNGFKTIADLRSIDQVNALQRVMEKPKFRDWINKNLPQTTQDTDSEVDQ